MTNIIDKIRRAHGYTKKELAQRSGLSYYKVKRLCDGQFDADAIETVSFPFGGIDPWLVRTIAKMEAEK